MTASPKLAALILAINQLDAEVWNQIEERTRARLLAVACDGEDDRSNRVHCRALVTNVLYDIAGKP